MVAARTKPPAVLIVNPNAGRLSERARSEAVEHLSDRFRLEVFVTSARDSAIGLAADAAAHGVGVVIAFGGDGHVNEVVNGIVGTTSGLGIIPGGTMNVFARSLDVPLDPIAAADSLAERVREPARVVNLGLMDDRYFTFSAGCGFDAEAAELVELRRMNKRLFGQMYFYWSAFRVLSGSRAYRKPRLTLKGDFGEVEVSMCVACNTGPYAYLFKRPIALTPQVKLEGGLDVFGLKTMKIEALPFYTMSALALGDVSRMPGSFVATDQQSFSIASDTPFKRHVDGEPIAPSTAVTISLAPDALKVFA
jgi:diacylglycerol kinase family enzyme